MKKNTAISLVVLIISIVLIVILSGVIILSLNKNNVIFNANEARFKSDISAFKDELNIYITKEISNNIGLENITISARGSDIKKYIPSFNYEKYFDKICIVNDELKYFGNNLDEICWCKGIIDYEYVTNGLLLNYDAINNLGGVHDNKSVIWKDLSGNNNDAILSGFDYTTNSGWESDCLSFDGVNDIVGSIKDVDYKGSKQFTLEFVVSKSLSNSQLLFESSVNSNNNYGSYYIDNGEFNGINDVTLAMKFNTSLQRLVNHKKVDNVILPDVYNQISIQFDSNRAFDNFTTIFCRGVKCDISEVVAGSGKYNYDISNLAINNYPFFIGGRTENNLFTKMKLKTVRVYNKVLSDDEIKQNYEKDKIRYLL